MYTGNPTYWKSADNSILSEDNVLDLLCEKQNGLVVLDATATSVGAYRIGRQLVQQKPNVLLCSYEAITTALVMICKDPTKRPIQDYLMNTFQNISVLFIHDIDFWMGKETTQEIVAELFNTMALKTVVVLSGTQLTEHMGEFLQQLENAEILKLCR